MTAAGVVEISIHPRHVGHEENEPDVKQVHHAEQMKPGRRNFTTVSLPLKPGHEKNQGIGQETSCHPV